MGFFLEFGPFVRDLRGLTLDTLLLRATSVRTLTHGFALLDGGFSDFLHKCVASLGLLFGLLFLSSLPAGILLFFFKLCCFNSFQFFFSLFSTQETNRELVISLASFFSFHTWKPFFLSSVVHFPAQLRNLIVKRHFFIKVNSSLKYFIHLLSDEIPLFIFNRCIPKDVAQRALH